MITYNNGFHFIPTRSQEEAIDWKEALRRAAIVNKLRYASRFSWIEVGKTLREMN